MSQEILVERLFASLISGDRPATRQLVSDVVASGTSAERVISDLFWPTYEMVQQLFRTDQLSTLAHHFATRLLRVMVDQTALRLEQRPLNGRRVFAVCGHSDADELSAQMAVDLVEAAGFEITFPGGGIANDEILGYLQEQHPDILLLFASAARDLPNIRELIDTVAEIGACRKLQIVVGGGVFNRAEGLAEEIGADLWATKPTELVQAMLGQPQRRAMPEQRTVGRKRKVQAA